MNASQRIGGVVIACTVLAAAWAADREAPRNDPNAGVGGLPVGTITAYAGNPETVPEASGWMLCDGRQLPVAAFPALYAALGNAWGAGPANTFHLPDLRGRFLRGLNAGAPGPYRDADAANRLAIQDGGNTGDRVGTLQVEGVGSHHHAVVGLGDATGPGYAGEWVRFFGYKVPDETASVVTNFAAVQPVDGGETRPVNAAVHWIIRVR